MENRVDKDPKNAQLYSSLDDLNMNNESRCVLVRLLRKWEARNFKKNKELMGIDFLLLDEEDCLIQGSVNRQILDRFKDILKEGQIYIIHDFDLSKSGPLYKTTDHQFTIRFTDNTKLEEVDEGNHAIRLESFRLRNHKDLLQMADKLEDLPDVIGFISEFEKADGESSLKRATLHIILEEEIKIRITVWGDLAVFIEEELSKIKERTIVVVATSLIPKTFSGKLFLSTSSASRFYLNADFETIRDFQERMTLHPQVDDNYKRMITDITDSQLHSIADILKYVSNGKKQVKEFTCKATIKDIILRNGWNYIACSKCTRKMEKTQSSLSCNGCNVSHAVGVLRFRIEVVVDDGSGTTTFVIFDRDAQKITNTTASTLMEKDDLAADKVGNDQTPACILKMVGKKFKFRVKVTEYNFKTKYQSFTVSRILDDTSKSDVEEPKQKEKLDTQTASGSSRTSLAKIKVEDARLKKDSEKLEEGRGKRRKVQKKTTNLHVLEDSE